MDSEQQYKDIFTAHRDTIDTYSAPVLNALRGQAFDDFDRLGFPTQRKERYKYTDVAAAFAPDYGLNLRRVTFPVDPQEAFRCDVPNLGGSPYFVVNDVFYDKSLPAAPAPGVVVCSLREAAQKYPDLVAARYGRLARSGKDAINALNTMLAEDGLFVYVPRGVAVERTVQVVNLLRSTVDLMVNRRVLVVVEDGACLRLLFCDHAMDSRRFLATQVVEVYVGADAHLELYELEETHDGCNRFSNLYVDQQRGSSVDLCNFTLQGGLSRNRTDVSLSGEGAEVNLYGCAIAGGQQHVDNNTLVDHRSPRCTSNQLYKYVMDDQSTGAFAGRILVREGAEKSVSQERNANLCATKEARVYSQPMLEIYADDVKCSHGSTVGQMDEAALFYMRQRGVSLEEARLLLRCAFAEEVISSVRLEVLRQRLSRLVEKRFRGSLGRCSDCRLCK